MTYNVDGSGTQHFIQAGWIKQPAACGSSTQVFWEAYDGSTYTNGCYYAFPSGDNDYAT